MNSLAWQEAKLATLLYLDSNHYIFEFLSPNSEHARLTFTGYTPWECGKRVIGYLYRKGFVSASICTINNDRYRKYAISAYGRKAFHWGQEI